jgi:membrane-associated two-gene conflict system component 1 (EACC1)
MDERFEINVQGSDPANSQVLATELASALRLISPMVQVERIKDSDQTMDLGAVVGVVVASGAAAALARGVAAWLSKRQGAEISVSKDGIIQARGLNSTDAVRVAQIIAGAH